MLKFFRSRVQSFGYAFRGWSFVIRTQKNALIHALITIAVIMLAFWLRLSTQDWAILLLAIAMVWAAEFFNTAIEAMVDLASTETHPLAKISKDVGAGAVLIAALGSVLIGLLILGPPLWARIQTLIS